MTNAKSERNTLAEDCVRTMNELASCCIETDFLYEKDGESGLWLEITGGKLDG